jgi:hypothetical protein
VRRNQTLCLDLAVQHSFSTLSMSRGFVHRQPRWDGRRGIDHGVPLTAGSLPKSSEASSGPIKPAVEAGRYLPPLQTYVAFQRRPFNRTS